MSKITQITIAFFFFSILSLFGFVYPKDVFAQKCCGVFNCCMQRDKITKKCIIYSAEVPCSGSNTSQCTTTYPDSYCSSRGWTVGNNGCFWTTGSTCTGGYSPTPSPTPTPTPTPPPPPSCTVSLTPSSVSLSAGSQESLVADVVPSNGTVDYVRFSSSNTSVATVNPSSDSSSPYVTTVNGLSVGSATITADVVMNGAVRCTDTSSVSVTNPGPWWQVIDADVATGGNLISLIPSTCTLPACNPVFDLDGAGGFPGVPAYAGTTADFAAGAGTGTVSSKNWLVNTSFKFKKVYDYSFFESLIPNDVAINEITQTSVNGGYFASGGTPSRGYVWYHFDGAALGDLTINSSINLPGDRKVILLVDGGNLYIQGRINFNRGQGFFMAIVGKTDTGAKGNIYIDPTVAHPSQIELEGVFFADGEIRTGVASDQLHIRGMVAALDGVILERDLTDNSSTPAEVFEYAPDLIFTYPRELTRRKMRWKEVAP